MRPLAVLLLAAIVTNAQQITTIAGGYLGDNGPATAAWIYNPQSVAVGPDGSIYIAETVDHRIRKITPDGRISTFAGTGDSGFSGDNGPATNARLYYPAAITVAATDGSVYIVDTQNIRIRKVTPDGKISTIAGTGVDGFAGDGGNSTAAKLSQPTAIAWAPDGSLYIADTGNNRIRKITLDGKIATFAGTGTAGDKGDGSPATTAQLNAPQAVAAGTDGSLYIADTANNRIRKITADGKIATIAGTGATGDKGDGGKATSAQLDGPISVAIGKNGILYIVDAGNNRVRQITPDGIISPAAGTGEYNFSGDGGDAAAAALYQPESVAVSADNTLYIADTGNNRIRTVSADRTINTIAGANSFIGDGEPATNAVLYLPTAAAVAFDGSLLISDTGNDRIRKIAADGTITTVAGNGSYGGEGDGGDALNAQLYSTRGLAAAPDATLYIADSGNHRIRKVAIDGTISTIAGDGSRGFRGDGGPAINAKLDEPRAVAISVDNILYIADTNNNRIRKITPNGNISTIAGNQTDGGFGGDDGPATAAQLNDPESLTIGPDGSLYIADTGNNRIRKITPDGKIATVAGGGSSTQSGIRATNYQFSLPTGVAVATDGVLYIVDGSLDQVLRVATDGTISVLAGISTSGFSGDNGPASKAQFNTPITAVIGRDGNLYLVDRGNNRIRRITLATTPTLSTLTIISGNNQTAGQGAVFPQSLTVQANDSTGAPAPGVVITFAVQSGSAILSTTRATTGADGRASITVQAGPTPGPLAITASAGTLSATFTLTVTSAPTLTSSATQVSFSAVSGGTAPVPQQLIVASAGTPVLITVQATSAGNWLKGALSASTSPATLTITVDPTGLNIGAYTGTVAISSPAAANSPLQIQVSLNVTAPATIKVTLSSMPAGLSILVDGAAVTTPADFNWIGGSNHSLDVPTPQALGPATRYTFDHWSQGGTKAQTITVPLTPATYTASLAAQYLLSASSNPANGGALNVSPSSPDGFFADSAQVRLTASAASGYTFANFSGDVTGSSNPQVITMSAPRTVAANFTANAVNSTVTISSKPIGRLIVVDGIPITAPQDFNWAPGSTHLLDVQSPQGVGFTRYGFDQWSNGGARSQSITTPTAAITYTASFIAQQLLTITSSPSNGGTITANPPSADGFYNQGAAVQLTAAPATGFTFANFTGDLTGASSPQTITLTAPKSVAANFTAVSPLTVNPPQLSLTATQGSNATAALQVDGGTAGQSVTVDVDQPWLRVSPSQGNAPFSVNVVAASSALATGSYRGSVTLGGAKTVAVNFQVTAPVPTAQLITDSLAAGLQFNLYQNSPPPGTQHLNITSSDGSTINYTANVTYPPTTRSWVSLSARTAQTQGTLDIGVQVTALGGPGIYTAVLTLAAPGSQDVQVPLTLTYTTPPPSSIQVDIQDLKLFSTGDVQNSSVVVRNTGPALLSFNVSPQPDDPNAGNWLRVNPAKSSAIVDQPSVLQITADPAGLATGTYRGSIEITANQQTATVKVVLAVNQGTKMLRSAVNGLSLRIGKSYTDFPPQTLELLAYGKSSVAWAAQADSPWIRITPAAGVAQPGTTAGSPQVTFNLAQLQAGSNKGAITIQSDSAGGDLIIPVEVQLLPAGVPVNRLEPVGLVFVPPFSARTDVVYVPSVAAPKLNISSNQPDWLKVQDISSGPTAGAIHKLQVTVDGARLPAGTPQSGLISIQEPNGVYAALSVLAYLPAAGSNSTGGASFSLRGVSAPLASQAATTCIPSQYIPLGTSFFQNFEQTGGAATTTEIAMVDDCGNPVSTGVMGGVLGNGDPQLNLLPLGDGRWKTTWNPTAPNSYVTLSIIGADPDRQINPTAPVQAASSITSAPTGPVLAKDQPFETEGGVRLRTIAPNLQFRIRGQNFLNPDGAAPKVKIGGRPVVVVNATATQLVVLTPADLAVNVESQLVIQRADATSVPEPVIIANQ